MNTPSSHTTAHRVAFTGMLFALAIVLSVTESMIAPLFGLPPGIKPGLSNIVVMYALFFLGTEQSLLLVFLKGFFVFLTRGVAGAALSLTGGLVSLGVMLVLLLLTRQRASYLMLSVAGAVSHNMGQLLMASLLLATPLSLAYAPILIVAGIAMGTLTSLSLRAVLPALGKIEKTF
ncbi:MAG: Gx transporter family protein [Pygmaiobacter sp.]